MAGTPKRTADRALIAQNVGQIEEMLASGMTQDAIVAHFGIGKRTWYEWVTSDAGREVTARARAIAASLLAEQTLAIADDATTEDERVARLRIDARRWVAGKWSPQQYGDRIQVDARVLDVTQLHMQMLRELAQRPAERAIEGESFSETDRLPNKEATPVDKSVEGDR